MRGSRCTFYKDSTRLRSPRRQTGSDVLPFGRVWFGLGSGLNEFIPCMPTLKRSRRQL